MNKIICLLLFTFWGILSYSQNVVTDGVIFSIDGKTLIKYPTDKFYKEYIIPEGTEIIDRKAFVGAQIGKVTLPTTLTHINDSAFYNGPSDFILTGKFPIIGNRVWPNDRRFEVTESNPYCRVSDDGFVYSKDGKTVHIVPIDIRGYLEDIDAVAGKMADDLQMMVFSATIPQNLRPFLKKYMQSPITIEIDSKLATTANVEHILLATKHQDRYDVLKKIMATIDPYICIIFANKRTEVSKITRQLREDGYKVGEIHGDLEPRERKKMMRQINNNEYQYIVATDIAARGIDIDGVSHVINMQFPTEPDFYIHRSGRSGRGNYTGICYSMYDTTDEKNIAILERKGIEFKNMQLKNGQFVDLGQREKRKKRIRQQTELEKQVQMIIRKPKKVKPGYKKKRKYQVEQVVRKQKRAMIRDDIRRQKKERARQAQIAKRMEEGNDNW